MSRCRTAWLLAVAASLALLSLTSSASSAAPVGNHDTGHETGQTGAEELPPLEPAVEAPSIIPEPNSGSPPDNPGDRGGWQQLSLLALMIVAVTGIFLLARRESRRKRTGRHQPAR